MTSCRPIGRRPASNDTRRTGSTTGSGRSVRTTPSPSPRSGGTVRIRKTALGLLGQETFVPQSYTWGQQAQVDWYEAQAELGDQRQTLHVFCMRSMASAAAFHLAYPRATQQAFLEAHELAFRYVGGVFRLSAATTISGAPSSRSCVASGVRKRHVSWPSGHTGDFRRTVALQGRDMRRAASTNTGRMDKRIPFSDIFVCFDIFA